MFSPVPSDTGSPSSTLSGGASPSGTPTHTPSATASAAVLDVVMLVKLDIDLPTEAFGNAAITAAFRAGLACALGLNPGNVLLNSSTSVDVYGKPVDNTTVSFTDDFAGNLGTLGCDALASKSATGTASRTASPTGTANRTVSPTGTASRTGTAAVTPLVTRTSSGTPATTPSSSATPSVTPQTSALASCSPTTCAFRVQPFLGSARFWRFSIWRDVLRLSTDPADLFRAVAGAPCYAGDVRGSEWVSLVHANTGKLLYFDGLAFRADVYEVGDCPDGIDSSWQLIRTRSTIPPGSVGYNLRLASGDNVGYLDVDTSTWLNVLSFPGPNFRPREWVFRYDYVAPTVSPSGSATALSDAAAADVASAPRRLLAAEDDAQPPVSTRLPRLRQREIVTSLDRLRPGMAYLHAVQGVVTVPLLGLKPLASASATASPSTILDDYDRAGVDNQRAPIDGVPMQVIRPASITSSFTPTPILSGVFTPGSSSKKLSDIFLGGELLVLIDLIGQIGRNFSDNRLGPPTVEDVMLRVRKYIGHLEGRLRECFALERPNDVTSLEQ